ncbi:D-alanyl-D-alanine endopeptidase [Solimicrobium silvestre]|uniref:D-alanyl-D-alanine carboxypeptidase n=1 Tax=Solimicrobium silvestre TaxID=2099400 RepID=A0A2S9H505_9BURK|nr:D-alanyl-D-alanine endopeptidase [Solimicrobium silvestre]PRC95064.1 D-alanyl-D-alanine carboxypeptidase [Solimicrobium silvestre]
MLKFSTAFAIALLFSSTTIVEAKTQTTDQTTAASTAAATPSTGKAATKKATVTKKATTTKKTAKKATKAKSKKTKAKSSKVAVVPEKQSFGDLEGLQRTQDPLDLKSSAALVIDQASSQVLFEKNSSVSLPIASITKLMTSLVVLEANQDMDEVLLVTNEDIDTEKGSSSRLKIGSKLKRSDMLHIALMSSENRAASSLGRNYPGGLQACVAAMNAKAKLLGMTETHYVDSTGLSSQNVASAQDLAKLVNEAYHQTLIRQYSTDTKYAVSPGGRTLEYTSSNRLTSNADWEIGLQKTGYITEAGRCLVMQAMIEGRAVVMVFLDSKGKYSRFADAGRIRKWLETIKPPVPKTVVQ